MAPFDSDCTALVSTARATELGLTPRNFDETSSDGLGWEPFYADSAVRIGAFSCGWVTADGISYSSIQVMPSAAISDSLRQQWPEWFTGERVSIFEDCQHLIEANGIAVVVNAAPDVRDEVVGDVTDALESADEPVIGTLPLDAWQEPLTCDVVMGVVKEWSPTDELEPGLPTDVIGVGPFTEGLRETAPYVWCPLTGYQENTMIAAVIQPGHGAPSEARLEALKAEPYTVLGADNAWVVREMPYSMTTAVVAVVGSNRVTIAMGSQTRSEEELVGTATSIIAELLARHR